MWLALLRHSTGVLALLLCFVLPEYLVWIHVSIGFNIRVANPNMKKGRPLPLPETPSYYIQPRIRGGVGSPIHLFFCDVLQNWLDFHVYTHHTKQFSLQMPQFIITLDDKSAPFADHSVIHTEMSPQTQTEGVSGTS